MLSGLVPEWPLLNHIGMIDAAWHEFIPPHGPCKGVALHTVAAALLVVTAPTPHFQPELARLGEDSHLERSNSSILRPKAPASLVLSKTLSIVLVPIEFTSPQLTLVDRACLGVSRWFTVPIPVPLFACLANLTAGKLRFAAMLLHVSRMPCIRGVRDSKVLVGEIMLKLPIPTISRQCNFFQHLDLADHRC